MGLTQASYGWFHGDYFRDASVFGRTLLEMETPHGRGGPSAYAAS